jgi:hypothetical protein
LVSNASVERFEKRTRPVGLRLAILFVALSAGAALVVCIGNLRDPFPIPGHLMGEPDFATFNGLGKYAQGSVFILLFNVPLLYGGIARAFDLGNAGVSGILAFASVLFGIAAWGLYRLKNWARLLVVAISVFTFLPMLGGFPPFFVDSFAAMTAFLPFAVPYTLILFLLRRDDVRRLFA